MNIDTFGSPEQYPTIKYISKKLDELLPRDRKYISSFLTEFQTIIKPIPELNATHYFKTAILKLIRQEYMEKLHFLELKHQDNKVLVSHIKNFLIAKIRKTESEITQFEFLNAERKSLI